MAYLKTLKFEKDMGSTMKVLVLYDNVNIISADNGGGKTMLLSSLYELLRRNDPKYPPAYLSIETTDGQKFEYFCEKKDEPITVGDRINDVFVRFYDTYNYNTAMGLKEKYKSSFETIASQYYNNFTDDYGILRDEMERFEGALDILNKIFPCLDCNKKLCNMSSGELQLFCLFMIAYSGDCDNKGVVLLDNFDDHLDIDTSEKVLSMMTQVNKNNQYIVSALKPITTNLWHDRVFSLN